MKNELRSQKQDKSLQESQPLFSLDPVIPRDPEAEQHFQESREAVAAEADKFESSNYLRLSHEVRARKRPASRRMEPSLKSSVLGWIKVM
jgi:hypothetical protein